jgi:hypothetical protein
VPHRRPRDGGSFGSHFDELVMQFPDKSQAAYEPASKHPARLQEKLDIHRLLFERAWRMDGRNGGES